MSEGDIATILRAIGNLEGKVDGMQSTLAEMARRNEQRDDEAGNHETRIHSLEEWRDRTKDQAVDRRRSWREILTMLGGWVLAATELLVHIFGGKGAP
jgi:hypothetical protein